MKKVLLIILTTLFSCNYLSYEIKFTIKNNSNYVIDSLKIEPDVDIKKYINLKPNESKLYLINFPDAIKNDGCYLLKFKMYNQEKSKCFGYYTNGTPLNEEVEIIIENDTIKYNYKLNTSY